MEGPQNFFSRGANPFPVDSLFTVMLSHLLPTKATLGVAYDNIGRSVNLNGKALSLGPDARVGSTVGVRFHPCRSFSLSEVQVPLVGASARVTLHAEDDALTPGELLEAWDGSPGLTNFSSAMHPVLEAWRPHWLCVTNMSTHGSRLWWLRSDTGREDWFVRLVEGQFQFAAAERSPGLRLVGQSVEPGAPRRGRIVEIQRAVEPRVHANMDGNRVARRFQLVA
jgi:hypothetical protein